MKFLFILTHVEKAWEDAPPGEGERVYEQYMAIERELKAQGKLLESARLRTCRDAKTVHNHANGKRTFVNGPHTESKEVMGGYYVIECNSIDEAFEWAKRMPNYGHGSIEVRPFCE